MNKNETIKTTLKATKAKRKTQMCKVYETKIDLSHLNHATQEHLTDYSLKQNGSIIIFYLNIKFLEWMIKFMKFL